MAALPKIVREAWENHEGPAILTTVSEEGIPNVIYVTCVGSYSDDQLVVADNFFDKTRKNVLNGCRGAMLFMTKDGKAYQVKGMMSYHKEGEVFEQMKGWNPPEHPGHAAAVLTAQEVYSGAEKLL